MSGDRDFSTRPRPRRIAARDLGLLAVALLAVALASHAVFRARTVLADARARTEEVRREIEADRDRVRALESRRGPGSLALQALMTSEAPPPRVVADLAALLPDDVRLEGLALSYADGLGLELQVSARRARAYDLFLDRLAQSPRIAALAPGAESRDGEVRASVRARYQPLSR
jgi:hypothetical protein